MSNDGPSPENLRHLRGMLPSFIDGMEQGKLTGRGRPATRPKCACGICGHAFMGPWGAKEEIKTCDHCQKLLDDGYTAIVCGLQYAFIKSPRLPDMAGKVMNVKPHVMAKVMQQFEDQKSNPPNGSTPPKDPA
jgi:hypothetical protein